MPNAIVNRVYSQLVIKSVDEEQRIIEGIATTPSTDLADDIVDPLGGEFTLPLPFLMDHGENGSDDSVGHVIWANPTKDGIEVRVKILQDPALPALDKAWAKIKLKLVNGLSIGFAPIESSRIEGTWGNRYTKWKWLELSGVVVACNSECSITTIKSTDLRTRQAALGTIGKSDVVHLKSIPGVSGKTSPVTKKGTDMATIAEQIASFEAKRSASAARMTTIMSKAGDEGRTLDDAEIQEYDDLEAEIKTIDAHISRLKKHEVAMVASATPVNKTVGIEPAAAAANRGGAQSIVVVGPTIDKGIAFTRYVKSLIAGQGNPQLALMHAEAQQGWKDSTPQVAHVLKTAVAGGTTTSAGWAAELVYNQNLVGEFIELLRPQTIIGKIPGMISVPFNVRMSGQDSGSSANWVGQGKPIPVSKLNTISVTLGMAKVAGLVVLTKELVQSSAPSAELLVRNDLMKTIATFCDVQFVDPNIAEVSNVSPASITNGVTPVTPTGTTAAHLRADVQTLFTSFINANDDPTSCVWIMDPTMALAISLMLNALGQPEFPGITMFGGTFFGLPVVVSNAANITGSPGSGHMIILAKASDILFADDMGLEIEASAEASLQMLDNPTNASSDGTATTLVSMFQTNSVAIRAIRPINWKKRRATAVAYIREAQYVA